MHKLLTAQTAAFESVLDSLPAEALAQARRWAAPAATAAVAAGAHWSFNRPAEAVEAVVGSKLSSDLRRGLVALWALDVWSRVPPLPQEVLALYGEAIDRLAAFLKETGQAYDPDYWVKDLRFVLGLTSPSGAQVVDLHARLGPGELVRGALAARDPSAPLTYLAAQGWGPWFQIHTESRHLDEFTPEGWDRTWLRIAALLRSRPEARGVLGASWFYDPPLKAISPRLAYLQDRPVDNGAFLLLQGADPLSRERATATSPTRRQLVESGEYLPRSWIMAWPRAALLRWAAGSQASAAAAA